MTTFRDKIDLIGVPVDLGVKELGLKLGPDAFREIGLPRVLRDLGMSVCDRGNIPLPAMENKETENGHRSALIADYCRVVAKVVEQSLDEGRLPVCLGGDHSMAIASLRGTVAKHGRVGCLWLDAHPDANTPETSPSGNVHGMVLAIALGYGPEVLLSTGRSDNCVLAADVSVIGAGHRSWRGRVSSAERCADVHDLRHHGTGSALSTGPCDRARDQTHERSACEPGPGRIAPGRGARSGNSFTLWLQCPRGHLRLSAHRHRLQH